MRNLLLLVLLFSVSFCPSYAANAGEPSHHFVMVWGEEGSGPGQFSNPIGIAIAGDEVFVSDAGNNRIQVFSLQGKFLRMFGRQGSVPGELGRPMHMDIREDKLYVAEYHRVGQEPCGSLPP